MTTNSPLILVVDDEPMIRLVACAALAADRYRTIEVSTGEQAVREANAQRPDAILLDLGLPDMDGLEVIRAVRTSMSVPIVVFSARGSERDKLAALDAGAADYLAKPFVANELRCRMNAILRPAGATHGSEFVFDDLHVDLLAGRIRRDDQEIVLTPVELRLLNTLVTNTGRLLTYGAMMKSVWSSGPPQDVAALKVAVSGLRRKIETDPVRPRHVLSETGVGYRWQ
jgi:two-component system KDP operon response regulator KdpE